MSNMVCRDVYARHTLPNGDSYVMLHRVWDAERFFASQAAAAAKVNEQESDPAKRKAKVEQITAEQYQVERKARS